MFAFGKKKGPVLGLDVSSETLTLTQLAKTKNGVELTRFATLPTPPNCIREGLIADPEILGGVLLELAERAGISGMNASINVMVPGQSVVVRLMPVPTGMPQEELADIVVQEAINHVPFPMREANLDWSIMGATERTDADGVRRVDIILAAIQKTIVESYWRMSEVAGLKLSKIDISSLAAIRGLSFAGYLQPTNELTMIVNIRHDATDINLVKNGMPLFTRSVLLGVETLGEAVSRSLDINLEEAFHLLPQVQLAGTASVDPKLGQVAQIARTIFGDITDEVGRSLEFYRSQVGEVTLNQAILCGSGCAVSQLDQFISNRLNIPTIVADPLRDVMLVSTEVPQERRAALTMVLGVGVPADLVPMPVVELNLNKEERSQGLSEAIEDRATVRVVIEKETPWFKPALITGAILVLISAMAWAYLSQYDLPKKQVELNQIKKDIEVSKTQLKSLDKLKEENVRLAEKKQLLDEIVNKRHPWSAVLQVVGDCTPEGVRVQRLRLSDTTLMVDGSAIDFTKISNFAINLSNSQLLSDASIDWEKRKDNDLRIIEFSLAARIKKESTKSQQNASAVPPLTADVSLPQVLDFYADWCGPCRQMKPIIEASKIKYAGRVNFVSLNVDDQSSKLLAGKYKVRALPTLCFLNAKGEMTEQIVGFSGAAPIYTAVDKLAQSQGSK